MLTRFKTLIELGKKDAFFCMISHILYLLFSAYLVNMKSYDIAIVGLIGFIIPIILRNHIIKKVNLSINILDKIRYTLYGFGALFLLNFFLGINLNLHYLLFVAFFLYSFHVSYFFWFFSSPNLITNAHVEELMSIIQKDMKE